MFRYWLPAGSSDSLTVHVLLNGELSGALWQHSGVLSSGWEVAEVNVSSHAEFRVSGVNNTQIQSRVLPSFIPVSLKTHLMSFTRWCFRPPIVQTPGRRWKSMTFLGRPERAVLQGAVTLSLDNATFSMSVGKMDTTGCWLMEASRVQKQITPLKPRMVDALSHLQKNMNTLKKNPTSIS